jgi:hypothetical protein
VRCERGEKRTVAADIEDEAPCLSDADACGRLAAAEPVAVHRRAVVEDAEGSAIRVGNAAPRRVAARVAELQLVAIHELKGETGEVATVRRIRRVGERDRHDARVLAAR